MGEILDPVEVFYNKATELCAYIEKTVITQDVLPKLSRMLMELYICGLQLPEVTPDSIDDKVKNPIETADIRIFTKSIYWETFDPFKEEESAACDFFDDLQDIRSDLLKGIYEYEAGNKNNAVFDWRFGLDNHWGNHVVSLIRALHYLRKG